ncbi:hypothetical protein HDU67_003457, partial [Dinochytrium kinnereticum]
MGEGKRMKVADVLLALGDISLELGQWSSAIEDFSEAVRMKESLLTNSDRELAEAHYKLALAFEFSKDFSSALKHTTVVVEVLERKLEMLKKVEETVEVQNEVKDIEGLMPDIKTKVEELTTELNQSLAKESEEAAAPSTTLTSSSDETKSTVPVEIKDVSGLVRRKNVGVVKEDGDASGLKRKGGEEETGGKKAKVEP